MSYKMTDEHKRKLSEAHKGKKYRKLNPPHVKTPEHLANLKAALTNPIVYQKRKDTLKSRIGVESMFHLDDQSPNKPGYWIRVLGCDRDTAYAKVIEHQKYAGSCNINPVSPWTQSYWINKGFSPEDATVQVSKIQSLNALKCRANNQSIISKAETIFLDKLQTKIGKPINRCTLLCDRFLVDGYIPEYNAVIEFFGDFWHMNPKMYKPTDRNKVNNRLAQGMWNEDGGRIKYLSKAGYTVFVVWESDDHNLAVESIASQLKGSIN